MASGRSSFLRCVMGVESVKWRLFDLCWQPAVYTHSVAVCTRALFIPGNYQLFIFDASLIPIVGAAASQNPRSHGPLLCRSSDVKKI